MSENNSSKHESCSRPCRPDIVINIPEITIPSLSIRLDRSAAGRGLTVGGLGLVVLLPALVVAGDVDIPHTFTSGDPVSAVLMNANFSALETAIDDNDARLDDAPATYVDVAGDAMTGTLSVPLLQLPTGGFSDGQVNDLGSGGAPIFEVFDNAQPGFAIVSIAGCVAGGLLAVRCSDANGCLLGDGLAHASAGELTWFVCTSPSLVDAL